MRRSFRVLLPLLVIGMALGIAQYLFKHPPQAKPRSRPPVVRSVEAMPLKPTDFEIQVRSYGSLQARTEGDLVAQVDGVVIEVAAAFRSGGSFRKGDLLLQLDPRDYEIELQIAEAALIQAQASLREERARGEEAVRDWKRLGRSGKPSALASREPQRQAADAAVGSARAQRDRARLQLSRTRILAPYNGRVLDKNASLGQYVGRGNSLARIYASDALEVRLPLNSRQLAQLDLSAIGAGPAVLLTAEPGGQQWAARIVRSEAAIDSASRQLHLVAELSAPGDARLGQFVSAQIRGQTLKQVFVIPRSAMRRTNNGGDEVLLIEDGRLQARAVEVLWSDQRNAVIAGGASGLAEGELLNLSPLGSVQPGARVKALLDGSPAPRSVERASAQPES